MAILWHRQGPDLPAIRRWADQAHQEGADASPPNKIRFGSFLQLFLFPGNRAGVTRYCGVAPSTPGRLGYGDDSGREIQERQKTTGGSIPCML